MLSRVSSARPRYKHVLKRVPVFSVLTVPLILLSCFIGPSGPTPILIPLETLVPPSDDFDDIKATRELAFAYWDAFNSYDADTTLSYLEAGYRAQREEEIRDEIGRLKRFRVKLWVTEEGPPTLTTEDQGEMYLKMKEPLGTRRIRMAFLKVAGDWRITFAEEVK